jgi:hypothetical protein
MKSDLKRLQFESQLLERPSFNDANFPKPMSCSRDPSVMDVSKEITWRVKRISNLKAFMIYRFLLTAMFLEGRSFTPKELFVLYELTDRFEQERCRSFLKEYGTKVNACIEFFDYFVNEQRNTVTSSLRPVYITKKFALGEDFLYHPNAYYGMKMNFKPLSVLVRDNRALSSKSSDVRYVGVGYKDKGNKKFAHEDGSPSWQSVAASQESAILETSSPLDVNKFYIKRRLFRTG